MEHINCWLLMNRVRACACVFVSPFDIERRGSFSFFS